MFTVLGYVLALLIVGGLLFLAASFAFGRGEEMAPVLPDGTPVELPDDRLADGDDLRALRLSVTVRGYRMDEVDWLLDRLSEQVDTRDREIARLRSVLHVEPVPVPDEPELLTHPVPAVVTLPADRPAPDAAPDAAPNPAGRSADRGAGRRGSTDSEVFDQESPDHGPSDRHTSNQEDSDRDTSGREGSGREGSGREGSGREGSGREGSGRDASGRDGGDGGARGPRPVRDAEPLDPDAPRLGAGEPTRGLPTDRPDSR